MFKICPVPQLLTMKLGRHEYPMSPARGERRIKGKAVQGGANRILSGVHGNVPRVKLI